ncbi:major facilitator superfamily domain-containing protein [Pilobolus umbonatus]|nr:major facilitator superfamily domain-containing protein [Pilobolus umbonatus]
METSPLLTHQTPQYLTLEDEISLLRSPSVEQSVYSLIIPEDDEDIRKQRLNGASLYTVLIGLWVGVSLAALDSSIVAVIFPQIGTEFGRSNEIIWIATAYMLSYTALQPLYGRISDIFGRKTTILFASVVFFIGSMLCGMATDLWTLVISRAIAGIGGGGINCMTTVICTDLVPLRERGKFQGYGNIAFAVGSVIGAPLGGFISDTVGWRYCFYINLPFLIITIYVSSCLLTNYNLDEKESPETWISKLKKIDYAGALSIVIAVIAFLVATTLGGNIKTWYDPLVIGFLGLSVIMVSVFCIVEAKWAETPLMPWSIITSQTPLACSLTNLWCVMSTTAMIYITPLYLQGLLGYSPSKAGLYFIPKVIFVSLGSVFSGVYMSRTGEYRNLTIITAGLSVIAMMGYTSWTPTSSTAYMLACMLLDGLSMGVVITTTLIAMLSCVGTSDMATITSMSYLFRSIGGVIGISASSAIFQGLVKSILTEKITGPDAEKYIEIARTLMTDVRTLLPPDILQTVLDAYQVSLYYTMGSCIIISFFAFISSFFIERYELATKLSKK